MSKVSGDLTVKEIAQETRLTEQCIYRKIRRGEIPSYRIGSVVRVRREDVDALRQPSKGLTPELRAEIRRAVDAWPPLTDDQRAMIAQIFSLPAVEDR